MSMFGVHISNENFSNDFSSNESLVVITNHNSDQHWDYVLKEMVILIYCIIIII